MRLIILLAGIALFTNQTAVAQQKWNLRTIVDYAMANNLVVKQTEVQAKLTALTYKQSRLSAYPNASFSGNAALNSGSNQDPTSFGRITETNLSAGMQLQGSADIFNFYSKRNTILANEWELKAALANVGKVKNDIALSAANAYLQILLAMEQERITLVQVAQTTEQLRITKKQVDAGSLPALNALQLEAQLAVDSVTYINAKGNVNQSILNLKAFMNIDAAAPFEVDTPPVESIPVEPIADLQPENVYNLALTNQPLQQYNAFRLKAAEKNKAAAKGAMYPSFSGFASLGSNYIAASRPNNVPSYGPLSPTSSVVTIGSQSYVIQAPSFLGYTKNGTIKSAAFGTQLNDNFRQSIGINMSVPIFSGGSLRTNYERSKLNINSLEIQKKQDDQQLKQDIYGAYNAAMIAMEKFNASAKSVSSSEQTYSFANKRSAVGMLSTFDLITTQNNLLRAKLEYSINQFDYVFKMKVLEFYKGQGLKL